MGNKITLMEASTFLGVSKATLRNWDRDGKLKATRNPINGYRQYDIDELFALKELLGEDCRVDNKNTVCKSDGKEVKRIISKMHNIIRDSDANSNIINRFDEISKLLFIKLYIDKSDESVFLHQPFESDEDYKYRLQRLYANAINQTIPVTSDKFMSINLSESAISKCGQELATIDLSSVGCDVKGIAYEDTIKGTFDKSDNQQYFTPYQIVDFMVQMIFPYIDGCVCDPACGTGGFLNKVSELCPDTNIIGLEVDERLAWVSNLNMLIHGHSDFSISCLPTGGSLGEKCKDFFEKADIIVTNPPFGSDYDDELLLSNFILGQEHTSRRRGILFIEQAWNILKENGVVAIIIDQSVLNASSTIDVRKYILSRFEILAIIDLPESAFLPYANVSTSILIMKKVINPSPKASSVFYAKAHNVGRKSNGDDDIVYFDDGHSEMNSDLPKILNQWNRYRSGIKELNNDCFIADVTTNLENDNTLRLDYIYHHPFREKSRELLEKCPYKLMTLAEICTERNESYIPSSDEEATTILFTGLANIESYIGTAAQVTTPAASIKSAVKRYEPNDIVFSKMRPSLRKVAVMHFSDGGYVSSECSVFTVKLTTNGEPIISPDLLSAIIRSDMVYGQIMSCITGIGRPRIGNKDLRKIKIPVPPKDLQDKALISLNASISSALQLKEKATALLAEAEEMNHAALNNAAKIMYGE